jgi:hypothetical protein
MKVHLVRRWGSHAAGESVEVDDTMGKWLLGTHHAEAPDRPGTARAGVVAPGTDGADLRMGGDLSRPGVPQTRKASRYNGDPGDAGENYANRAAPVAGAPRPVGSVSHVAEENLGREHKDNPGDVLLASGKTLRQEQQERQRELDKQQGGSEKAADGDAGTASGQSTQAPAEPKSAPKAEK